MNVGEISLVNWYTVLIPSECVCVFPFDFEKKKIYYFLQKEARTKNPEAVHVSPGAHWLIKWMLSMSIFTLHQ